MSDFETVLKTSDLQPGNMKLTKLGATEILIANLDGRFCAFSNICPHDEAPLEEGELEGDVLTCPWHFTRFNVRTGEVIDGITDEPISVFEVRVDGDDVQVAPPPARRLKPNS
jgi:nitrite reductase/ring-hydroxylating ferredoxin subunit